jgi:hypothetical protein
MSEHKDFCGTDRGYRQHLKKREPTNCGRGCREAHGRAVKARLVFRGQTFTSPARAAAHAAGLRASGMAGRAICDAAGICPDTLISLGTRPRILRTTEARILAVKPVLSDQTMIPRVGTTRRIRALLRMGWPHGAMSAECGSNTAVLLHARADAVTVRVARAVAEMYDRLWMKQGPSRSTALRAARLGHPAPLAWDDDTIDDPDVKPVVDAPAADEVDEIAVERFMAGTLRDRPNFTASPERVEAVRQLAAYGLSDHEIGQRVGMTATNVGQFRLRRGIPSAASKGTAA